MIRFTIVTCTYNAGNVLKRTLESVSEQVYPFVEHLIIDGVSEDQTLAIARSYLDASKSSKHSVVLMSEPDKGLYDAMNKGIKKAAGDYILFLNAGDSFPSKDTLSLVAGCAEGVKSLPGVLYGDTDIVNSDGLFLRHRRLSPPEKLTWKSFKYGMLVCHQAFYARTDFAKRNLYDTQYRYSADIDWCIRIMKDAEKDHHHLLNIHAVAVNYLDGGMTVENHKASLKERFEVMKHHYGLTTTVLMHCWFVIRAVFKK